VHVPTSTTPITLAMAYMLMPDMSTVINPKEMAPSAREDSP